MQSNLMAVVTVKYIKPGGNVRAKAKATIRYIQHRRGKDGTRITRTLFGTGGVMGKQDAYSLIDEAGVGERFFRVIINPDTKTEDTKRDLNLHEVIETTISIMREELTTREVSWVAAIHQDHTPQRHIHALVIAKERLLPAQLMIQTATRVCREQRRERDLLSEQQREQEQGKEESTWERERSK